MVEEAVDLVEVDLVEVVEGLVEEVEDSVEVDLVEVVVDLRT